MKPEKEPDLILTLSPTVISDEERRTLDSEATLTFSTNLSYSLSVRGMGMFTAGEFFAFKTGFFDLIKPMTLFAEDITEATFSTRFALIRIYPGQIDISRDFFDDFFNGKVLESGESVTTGFQILSTC